MQEQSSNKTKRILFHSPIVLLVSKPHITKRSESCALLSVSKGHKILVHIGHLIYVTVQESKLFLDANLFMQR